MHESSPLIVISAVLEGISSSRIAPIDTQVNTTAFEACLSYKLADPSLLKRVSTTSAHLHLAILHLHMLAVADMLTTYSLTKI